MHLKLLRTRRLALILGVALVSLLLTLQGWAFPITAVTFKDDAPFAGTWDTANLLTSSDGLLAVQGWSNVEATVTANLTQWWWVFGVNSGYPGQNGALLDGPESLTLQFDKSVGASIIGFLYTGDQVAAQQAVPQPITISGFSSDPGAYEYLGDWPYTQSHIVNLSYANGTLSFGYLYDHASSCGGLRFSNSAATAGQTLKIQYGTTNDLYYNGAGLFQVDSQELYSSPQMQPGSLPHNAISAYTTPDGGLAVRGYSDRNAVTPAKFGTYLVDRCFGVMGGGNNAAVNTNECVTLQFANGFGLSRFETVYATAGAQITISGFQSDPGFTDNTGGTYGASYAGGVLTFYAVDGGHRACFFTNRAASVGQTLRVTVDPVSADPANPNQLAIAGVGYAGPKNLLGPDIPSNVAPTYTTADGLLTVNGFSDTPGTTPANLYENVDWFGVAGGNNNEAIEGTESVNLQFAPGTGLSALGTRYTWANITLSGFASDPGFSDPSGMATSVNYLNGTLSFHLEAWHPSELVFHFANPAASANRTLSLHTSGDPGEQIVLTRVNYALAPVTISITRSGGDVVLTWPAGTLQQSSSVTGTYTNVASATSPYTNATSAAQMFYRVKVY